MPLMRSVLGAAPIKRAIISSIETRVKGPDAHERQTGRSYVWARASDPRGNGAEAWLETLEGYAFTAVAGVRAVERIFAKRLSGALTPALAFGADFVLEDGGHAAPRPTRRGARARGARRCHAVNGRSR